MKSNGTMKVNQKDLLGAMRMAQKVTDPKAHQPIVANVVIEALSQDRVAIRATDLDVTAEITISGACEGASSFTVNAKRLTALLRKLPKGAEIAMSNGSEGEWATFAVNSTEYEIATMPVEEYPNHPVPYGETVKVSDDFWAGVAKVLHAVSTDETRYTINGIRVEFDGDSVVLVATDGHQLAKYGYQNGEAVDGVVAILPRKAVHTALSWFKGSETWITIGETHAGFWSHDLSIVFRLIEGQFPNYEQIIEAPNVVFTVGTERLKSAIEEVAIFASDKSKAVKFFRDHSRPYNPSTHALNLPFQSQHVLLMAEDSEIGRATAKVEADLSGDFGFMVNAGYLVDALKAVGSDEVSVSCHDRLAPIQIRPVGSNEFLAVVMPMRF